MPGDARWFRPIARARWRRSDAQGRRHRASRWRFRPAIGLPALAVVLGGGAVLGGVLFAPDDRGHSAPAKPATLAIERAGIRLMPPAPWKPWTGITEIPGITSPACAA